MLFIMLLYFMKNKNHYIYDINYNQKKIKLNDLKFDSFLI